MKREKFKNIVLPLKDKLFRLALSITGSRQDAEDVVQDAMLRVWQKQSEWDTIENLEGYCLRSARNIALDKISLKDNQHDGFPEQFEVSEPSGNVADKFETEERLKIIHQLINELPEKQRTIMQLRDIEGLSYKEIAEIMFISEEQVKVTLFRARQKIKEHFRLIDNYGI